MKPIHIIDAAIQDVRINGMNSEIAKVHISKRRNPREPSISEIADDIKKKRNELIKMFIRASDPTIQNAWSNAETTQDSRVSAENRQLIRLKKAMDIIGCERRSRNTRAICKLYEEYNQSLWLIAVKGRAKAEFQARAFAARTTLNQEDLYGEALIALLEAAERFDPNTGSTFASYADRFIVGALNQYANANMRFYTVPAGAQQKLRELNYYIAEYEREGIEYTVDDLAARVNISPKRARELLNMPSSTSMEQTVGGTDEGDDLTIGDFVSDPDAISQDEQMILDENVERLHNALKALTTQQQFVLDRVFGLRGEPTMTMTEIGEKMGVSTQRVSAIKIGAVKEIEDKTGFKLQ